MASSLSRRGSDPLSGIPGPPGLPGLGNLLSYARDPLGCQLRWIAEHGDLIRYRLGRQEIVLTTNPELVRAVFTAKPDVLEKGNALKAAMRIVGEGLLTSEGEAHLRARRMLAPLFAPRELPGYVATMVGATDRHASAWRDGQHVDMAEELGALTLAIIARVLFHGEVGAESKAIGRALEDGLRVVARLSVPAYRHLTWLPLPAHVRFRRARRYLDELVYGQIEARRAVSDRPDDLLTRLLDAQDEEGDGGSLTDRQVRDEVLTLFLAGHETTANGIAWTLYLLAEHPSAEAKVRDEIATVLGDALPTADRIGELSYLRQVVHESLRLLPPVWNVARLAVRDFPLGESLLPAGTVVIVSPYVSHRQAAFWDEPDVFAPERWADEASVKRALRYRYFPFGGGRRVCIGEHFAIVEMVAVLATLLRRFSFARATAGPIACVPTITIRPRGGLPMRLVEQKEHRDPTSG